MRIALVIAIALLLSGCASNTPEPVQSDTPSADEHPDATPGAQPEMGQPSEGEAPSVDNAVPAMQVVADKQSGVAPLRVNFTITADDDSDELTWAFDINGTNVLAGTGLPATFNHTFEPGTWNLVFSVSDGEHTVNDTMQLDVQAPEVPEEPEMAPPQHYEGSTTASVGACPHAVSAWLGNGVWNTYPQGNPGEGVEWLRFDISPASIGWDFVWEGHQTLNVVFGVGFTIYDADGEALLNDYGGSGVVPEGAAFAVFWPCGPGPYAVVYDSAPAGI